MGMHSTSVRDIGTEVSDEGEKPFEELFPKLIEELEGQMDKSRELSEQIRHNSRTLPYK